VISGSASVIGSSITINDTGSIKITAWQPGSENFNPAPNIDDSLLVVFKIQQAITFDMPDTVTISAIPSNIALTATSSSGLPVVYTLRSGIGTISGTDLVANDEDYFIIDANQAGNTKYHPATTVTESFDVLLKITTNDTEGEEQEFLIVYPNPTDGRVIISDTDNKWITVTNSSGQIIMIRENVNEINLTGIPDGMYILQIQTGDEIIVKKVIKK
jgi:hypothetical protein